MRVLRFVFLLVFLFMIFIPVLADVDKKDYDWLMLKSEKKAFKRAKTNKERERVIEQFYKARDLDTFTAKNEFKINYQKNLREIRKEFLNRDDARRYVYLLYGEPKSRRIFTDQLFFTLNPYSIRIRVNKGEIWQYDFSKQTFQVIFATLNPQELQWFKDRPSRDVLPISFSGSRYEILYVGTRFYTDIVDFLESFFQESFRLQATSDTINDLKKPIIERAREFYKNPLPKVKKEKYLYKWKNWKQEAEPLVYQFDIKSSEEVGRAIWLLFDRDFLYYDSRKKKYKADISLYCEIRDVNNRRVIYYKDDSIRYTLKVRKKCYYRFWGSLPAGKYKFILELGDNIGRKHVRIEKDIEIFDYSKEGLKATLLIGKILKDKDIIRGKPSLFYFKEGEFCPAASGEVFRSSDELMAIFEVSGFHKNHYGNSYVETSLCFVKGKIEQGVFVESNEVYEYRFLPIEKDGDRFQNGIKIKIKDFNKKFKLSSGLHLFRVRLLVRDAVANTKPEIFEYPRSIRILCTVVKNINPVL